MCLTSASPSLACVCVPGPLLCASSGTPPPVGSGHLARLPLTSDLMRGQVMVARPPDVTVTPHTAIQTHKSKGRRSVISMSESRRR